MIQSQAVGFLLSRNTATCLGIPELVFLPVLGLHLRIVTGCRFWHQSKGFNCSISKDGRVLRGDAHAEYYTPFIDKVHNQWLPHKLIKCGQIIGLSIEHCNGGWNIVVAFVQERYQQKRTIVAVSKSKQKRKRELQNLACSNYDKPIVRSELDQFVRRGAQGSAYSFQWRSSQWMFAT